MTTTARPQRGSIYRVARCANCGRDVQDFLDGVWRHADTGDTECRDEDD